MSGRDISCRTTAARIAKLIADTPATVKDRETQKNLTAFAGALAAAKEPTEIKP